MTTDCMTDFPAVHVADEYEVYDILHGVPVNNN